MLGGDTELIRPGFLIGLEVVAALLAGKACQGR